MYYHGTLQSKNAPNAHADQYTFWLYPPNQSLINKWDTHGPCSSYCNNRIMETKYANGITPYICNGHTSIDDMKFAQEEWKKMKWDLSVEKVPKIEWDECLDDYKKEKCNDSNKILFSKKSLMSNYNEFIKSIYNNCDEDIPIFINERTKQYPNFGPFEKNFVFGFLYIKIKELEAENAKLRTEFKEILTALTIKKPVGQEIAELQARIVELYSNESKEYHS